MSGISALGPRPSALGRAQGVAEGRGPAAESEEKLKGVARQMQGLFVEQLFKAMRETVPQDGALSGGSGEEMFTGLMDSHIAAETPGQWDRGLGAAIYRQLRAGLHGAEGSTAGATAAAPTTNAPTPQVVEDRR